jgi:SAM-dependent methyltransferase
MLRDYLADVAFPDGARVLEVGCGTGAVTRTLARWPGVAFATGVDPSDVFLAHARALSVDVDNVHYVEGDARTLPFDSDAFDVVVAHTTLCHVPHPDRVLSEVLRVLRRAGTLAVFDGDYATATVATGPFDPLQSCVDAFRENYVNDPWLVRRLPALFEAAGFDIGRVRSHGYVEAPSGGYMLTWIERGADVLAQSGRIGADHARSLKEEATRRSAARRWFGHIAFASMLGAKR